MSIKKCIMNYFDKATNAMIPFHPQTESGAITDWHESVIGSLASKVLPTVVSELTTDSVMGKLMKMLLNASGVKYSIDTNGYVCLGSFFGGLIIQWGYFERNVRSMHSALISYPIDFPLKAFTVLISPKGIADFVAADLKSNSQFNAFSGASIVNLYAFWIAIGE